MRAAIYGMTQDIYSDAFHVASKVELILHGTALRDVLLEGFRRSTPGSAVQDQLPQLAGSSIPVVDQHPAKQNGIFSGNQLIHSWATRYQTEDPIVMEGDPTLDLNAPQIREIAHMIGKRISLVQGVR